MMSKNIKLKEGNTNLLTINSHQTKAGETFEFCMHFYDGIEKVSFKDNALKSKSKLKS